jgi:hypothetical protein
MQLFDMNTEEGRAAVEQYEREREAMAAQGQQLYAKIKRTSKYYGQTEPNQLFPVYVAAGPGYGEYIIQGGPGGQYRLSDVNLFVVCNGHEQRISR